MISDAVFSTTSRRTAIPWCAPLPRPGSGPDTALHERGHGAVQGRLPRRGAARLRPGGHGPEMRPRGRQAQRPRECRPHGAPPYVLRDARQLLLRRLLQAGCRGVLLGVLDPRPRVCRRRRLTATVFTDDDDAFALWKKVAGLGEDRILRLGEKDNFWAMGDTGPCGPCSEVHFHQGDHLPCAEEQAGRSCLGPACDCDRWLEIWNLVFMQFNRDASGIMTPLPKPSIDTGMGLERIAAVVQGKDSNYETDLLRPLIGHVERLSRKPYGDDEEQDVSMRVIADHARAATFLITDGVTPSNEWRGYVLRRIMRRAMRHGRMLGLMEPFLWDVTGGVVELMGDVYPELREAQSRVAETVRLEEERFAETLDLGMARIREYMSARSSGTRPAGASAPRRRQVPVHALRHVWLPAGPGPGGVPGRRLVGDAGEPGRVRAKRWTPSASGRAPARSFGAAGGGETGEGVPIYQQLSTEHREAHLPRLHGAGRAREDPGPRRRGAAPPRGERGRDRRGHPRPDARVCRVGRPDGRHRRSSPAGGAGAHRGHVLPRRAAHRPPRPRHGGRAHGRATRSR